MERSLYIGCEDKAIVTASKNSITGQIASCTFEGKQKIYMGPVEVYKFGGASVKDAEAIRNVGKILQHSPRPLAVVISAMGRTTNHLEAIIHAHIEDPEL